MTGAARPRSPRSGAPATRARWRGARVDGSSSEHAPRQVYSTKRRRLRERGERNQRRSCDRSRTGSGRAARGRARAGGEAGAPDRGDGRREARGTRFERARWSRGGRGREEGDVSGLRGWGARRRGVRGWPMEEGSGEGTGRAGRCPSGRTPARLGARTALPARLRDPSACPSRGAIARRSHRPAAPSQASKRVPGVAIAGPSPR